VATPFPGLRCASSRLQCPQFRDRRDRSPGAWWQRSEERNGEEQALEQSIETTLNGKSVSTFFTFLANTRPSAFVHLPGLALPMGMTADGLPVGMELDGPVGSDRRLLSIGLALAPVLGHVPAPGR